VWLISARLPAVRATKVRMKVALIAISGWLLSIQS
jgi:hypothetical protein